MNYYCVWIGALIIVLFGSCKKSDYHRVEKLITEWEGKEIVFPSSVPCRQLGEAVDCPNSDREFKVLLYVDSLGCSECSLKLWDWAKVIQSTDSVLPGKVAFLLYVQPKESVPDEISRITQKYGFHYPIYIDKEGELNRLNQFPQEEMLRCFLLDRNNRVLLTGNPARNQKVWELYQQVLTGTQ